MSSFTVGFHFKEDNEDCDPLETSTVQHFNEKGKLLKLFLANGCLRLFVLRHA